MTLTAVKTKTSCGNFFEDFHVGQVIRHGTPKTINEGDSALYTALYGSRFAVQSGTAFAEEIGYPYYPLDDLLVFHVVFGKTVGDISLNAVANLGYSDCRFLMPIYAGDTVSATSEVIGVKENSNGKTGVVYVRSTGYRHKEPGSPEKVLEYTRWVMVKKRDETAPAPETTLPELPEGISEASLGQAVPELSIENWDFDLSGSPFRFHDYEVGEKIDHVDGMTVEEAEHQLATRLYQNTAKVHFNHHSEKNSRFGKRLIYGGHVISLARALSFNGLGNAFHITGINAGRHVAPLFAGDTVYAWSEVLDKKQIEGRSDVAAMRMRLVATKDLTCTDFPFKNEDGKYKEGVILDLDYWVIIPV
ncbi:bifunctional aldehyde dehydrogenase/enoyl-CoA hydratase [Pseudovibrio axinellae]|uniref:Bifunctional aldehyde dehydrogenase/enoyl-CoA hydratase n=1 Tax=Pseudovibrio axinellae TaxID=989403 RepID=A0A166A4W6_9HYPH|nr:MaoC family dehydratase [Pseudovibrio axinellae]KZL20626.1 bifunctional aldehyde dehydrogenase/enoyl-CoA hydratase [Pseudovibrio axinellae]SER27514.1 L-erythro-3-methylmalyl-CoA dehydratase [Pseudovibrio axinellae]